MSVIKETASQPVLIATTHKSLVQVGEMMGIGLELKKKNELENVSFLLVSQTLENSPQATKTLTETVENISDPLEVWTVNFIAPIELKNCTVDKKKYPYIDGYGYQRYMCN